MDLDLNADLGEGFGAWSMGDDAAMIGLVTSASIACGAHAGDPQTMRRCCELAVAAGVRIGAHVGHRDLAGFGRRPLPINPAQLIDETLYQLGALEAIAGRAGGRVAYLKPHGALYHQLMSDGDLAAGLVETIAGHRDGLAVLGLPGSVLGAAAAAAGITYLREGFADRGYRADGGLVDRSRPGAVLDPETAAAQAVSLATTGEVLAVDAGATIRVSIDSLCVHGDTPAAVELTRRLRQRLTAAGVTLRAGP